jgi:hypothetical protein
MAYNPSLYNPYGNQPMSNMFTPSYQPQQPVNGLIKVTGIEGAQMYQLPPGSVSPPLFLDSENAFFVKTTDDGGAATIKKYKFEEEPIATNGNNSEFVTREYFDQQMNNILEAINGKRAVSEPEQPTA